MKIQLAALAAVIVTASSSAPAPRASTFKCPPDTPVLFPNAPDPVYVLNARAVDEAWSKRLMSSLSKVLKSFAPMMRNY
ncbi:MAG: hypothetical protein ACREMA_12830 [Longimicrobiales bacterium]